MSAKNADFKFEPIERKSIVTDITNRLLSYLLSGHLKPGDKLPAERQLAETIGVGRSSLREALKALMVLGLLEVRHGDGTYLKKADSELLPQVIEWGLLLGEKRTMDLIEARQIIEISVAALAAKRCEPEALEQLRLILQRMEAATNSQDIHDDYINADIAFHLKLAEIAQNTILRDMLTSIRSLLHAWIKSVIESAGSAQFSYEEHLAVFQAIELGDASRAANAMEAHMNSASSRLKQLIIASEAAPF
jgi:GntR family transcriptional repressor for pyruvate dehydrogenase complex